MKRPRILQVSSYLLVLGLGILLGFMLAYKFFGTAAPRYKKDAVIYIESEGYTYLARVIKDTGADTEAVPVHIFAAHLREKMGDTVPIAKVRSTREMPPDGWGTRIVAVEYRIDAEWIFSWDVREMEDHYLAPMEDHYLAPVEGEDKHRIELTDVRFPIPVKR